ncbi:CPBP family intramembrane glutamic endopeptidase [Natrialba swarupiae]|uniref:CPBP family intramembrane metalloprotease n=1 Tax=Natrialba swarupiae TaxID=2448032 RepID=A0A5D5AJN7_9EURY|nr:type II CAAX endopeptidase family protein [Natrialba swarupiae]TYT61959.1 CPBP family intramembrane metalloprotease [Natrialba swarupiae]
MNVDWPFEWGGSKRNEPSEVDRLWTSLGAATLVLAVIFAGIAGYYAAVGEAGAEPPAGVVYGATGVGFLLAGAFLWWRFDESERCVAFPVGRPNRAELVWTLAFVPLGVAAFVGGEWVAGVLGFEMTAFYDYDLTNPVTLLAVLFGPVIVGPLVEELIYRGALLSSLEGRGWSPIAAGLGSIVVFAGSHVFALGIAGVFAIAAWAVFPTVLRLRFENLTGAWLLHVLNNVYAYVIAVHFVL